MKKLTIRERVLLGILAILAVVCGYVFLFYLPAADRTAGLEASIQQSTAILDQSAAMLASQEKMEQELDAQLSGEQAPEEMPNYDNIQSIMVELNGILSDAQEYSLRFSSAQGEDHVMERRVTMPFTCSSYATAKSILHRIQESALRCQLEDLSFSQRENGAVQVTVTVVFYEYQAGGAEGN